MTAALLNHLWQSTLVAGIIGALTLLFRNNNAGIRHGLWFLASVKFLLPFAALTALGGVTFTHTVAASSLSTLARIEPAAAPFPAPTLLPAAEPHHLPWLVIAATIWLLGSSVIAAFWLLRAKKLSAIRRSATALALEAPVPVMATTELLEPGLVGILRPVILVPETLLERLSKTEIDAVLAHELCHLRRRDNLLAMIHMLVEGLFWFHPLVWIIGARLVKEREQACDEAVLASGKNPLDYAQAILRVCRLYFRSSLPCASGVSGSDLDRRITAIMARRDVADINAHKILLLAALGLFAIATPFVTGGLKPAAPLVQGIARMLASAEPAKPALRDVSPAPTRRLHRSVSRLAIPQEKHVVAPVMDASVPVIQVPAVQLATESAETGAEKTEAPVCRQPQQLPASRLLGPRVCLLQREWDRIAAQGLQLMPDGKTLATLFEKEHSLSAHTCHTVAANTGTAAMTIAFNCF